MKGLDWAEAKKISSELCEPSSFLEKRKIAFSEFEKSGLPGKKADSWRYTDPKRFPFLEKGEQSIEYIIKKKAANKDNALLVFTSMKEAISNHRSLLENAGIISILDFKEDLFAAERASFWSDGVFVFLPDDAEADIENVFSALKGSITTHSVIILGKNSRLRYVEKHFSTGDETCTRNDGIEFYLGENSSLEIESLRAWEHNVFSISSWAFWLSRDSRLKIVSGNLGGSLSRLKIDAFFRGSGSEASISGFSFTDGSQHVDLTTNAYHLEKGTTCNIIVKSALKGSSSSVYRGKIKIAKEAQQTTSYLADNVIILSEKAVSNSIPSLEIDANDVKASHGATTGKPDEEDLFYMMARGLKREEAERLIIEGFFSSIIGLASDEGLKQDLMSKIGKKARG